MKKIFLKSFVISTFLFLFFVKSASAASFGINSQSASVAVGGKVRVDLLLNMTSPESVWGYDAYAKYSGNLLTYNSSDFLFGNFFTSQANSVTSFSGEYINIGQYFDSTQDGITSGGVVASLFFTGKAVGSATIEIVCGQFSNIYSSGSTPTNIFSDCASSVPLTTIIVGPASTNPTSTPTSQPTAAPTSSSSSNPTTAPTSTGVLTSLPETGALDGMIRLIYAGFAMLLIGGIFAFGFARIKR